MGRKIYGIFVAGGSGTRMGTQTPKQFLELSGKPVLQRTIERFKEAEPDMKVITVLPHQHFDTWKDLCALHSCDCAQTLVAGGLTRFHSVKNALEKVPDGAIVIIQDGVRPFVGEALIREMVDKVQSGESRAVIPVVPVVDTLRSKVPGAPAPDRSSIEAVQTPQIFLSEEIREAYTQPYSTTFTDDASVAAGAGIPVDTVSGERTNIKITVPGDLDLGEAILALK